jgi:hypothetical protein
MYTNLRNYKLSNLQTNKNGAIINTISQGVLGITTNPIINNINSKKINVDTLIFNSISGYNLTGNILNISHLGLINELSVTNLTVSGVFNLVGSGLIHNFTDDLIISGYLNVT